MKLGFLDGLNIKGLSLGMGAFDSPLLPYSVDFSTQPNGNLPSGWLGLTWTISSGKAINTPTTGQTEMFANPGAEGTYSEGTAPNWIRSGSEGTWSEEGTIIHGGAKAQKFVGSTVNVRGTLPALVPVVLNSYYLFSGWIRNDGPGDASARRQAGILNDLIYAVPASGAYKKVLAVSKANASDNESIKACQIGTTSQTIYADDFSLKLLPFASLFSYRSIPYTNIILSFTMIHSGALGASHIGAGIFDSPTNPQNYLLAYYNGTNLKLSSFANRAETNLINGSVTWVNGELGEIRISGTTAQLWYAGAQVGADQTIGAAITACRYAGMYSNDPDSSIGELSVV